MLRFLCTICNFRGVSNLSSHQILLAPKIFHASYNHFGQQQLVDTLKLYFVISSTNVHEQLYTQSIMDDKGTLT